MIRIIKKLITNAWNKIKYSKTNKHKNGKRVKSKRVKSKRVKFVADRNTVHAWDGAILYTNDSQKRK